MNLSSISDIHFNSCSIECFFVLVMRGYMTANGQPDNPRTSRYILKDYQIGKLLYCHAPPNVEQESFHTWPERQRNLPKHIPPSKLRAMKVQSIIIDLFYYKGA